MPDTTNYALTYPAANAFVKDGPAAIQALAEDVDTKMVGGSAGVLASRPTSTPGSPGILGRRYFATDAVAECIDTGTGWVRAGLEAGGISATARSTAPPGYLLCDGAVVSRSGANADLFAAIGTAYGAGDGSTTFGLPDLRGRVPVGVDGAAGRLAANDALGQSAGAETHTLTTPQIPSHSHPPAGGTHFRQRSAPGLMAELGAGGAQDIFVSTTTGLTGGGQAHNNLQPYQVVNWLIKT
jgi:microcystin-dependent protein